MPAFAPAVNESAWDGHFWPGGQLAQRAQLPRDDGRAANLAA